MFYIGQAELPQACLEVSKMQQSLGDLKVRYAIEANAIVWKLSPCTENMFLQTSNIWNIAIVTFPGPSNSGLIEVCEQSGVISELKIKASGTAMYHPVVWCSHMQKKICYSSFDAKIFSAANVKNCGFYMKQSFPKRFSFTYDRKKLLVHLN